MTTYDALTTRGDNPQTWVGPSNAADHPFNRTFEERYDWDLLADNLPSERSAKNRVNRYLSELQRFREREEFEKQLARR